MDRELDAARVLLEAQRERRRNAAVAIDRLEKQLSEAKASDNRAERTIGVLLDLFPELADPGPTGPELELGETVLPPTPHIPHVVRGRDYSRRRGEPTGRALATGYFNRHPGDWFLISEIAEGLVADGTLDGDPHDHTNKLRIAILKLIDAGLVDREPDKAVRNAYRYRLSDNATPGALRLAAEGG